MSAIVDTPEEAAEQELEPLLVRRPLEAFLDARGLGEGALEAETIGEGHSNVTFAIRRDGGPGCCAGRRARRCRPRPMTCCARRAC